MARTLREILDSDFAPAELDLECTSLKVTLKTPRGGTMKTDYSARREAAIAKARREAA